MVPRCPYEIFPSRSNPTPPRSTKPTFAERFLWFGKDRPSRAGRRGRARGSEITGSASATPVENSATWRSTRKRVHGRAGIRTGRLHRARCSEQRGFRCSGNPNEEANSTAGASRRTATRRNRPTVAGQPAPEAAAHRLGGDHAGSIDAVCPVDGESVAHDNSGHELKFEAVSRRVPVPGVS